ncbi:MAG: aldose 1-epimerase [Gemmataceae bacterium]
MLYAIEAASVQSQNMSVPVVRLQGPQSRIEVWPNHGFNCLRWQVRTGADTWGDLLDVAPDWAENPIPTRSGHPILFPFPNRMRHATFSHAGTTYSLPKNESTGQHAIHGFTPRAVWRVVGMTSTDVESTITGEFQLSVDSPKNRPYWPADSRIRVTYTLRSDRLRVSATIDAADGQALPWGLGYHGYFRLPSGQTDYVVQAAALRSWKLETGIPTRAVEIVRPEEDFREPRQLNSTVLDHLYGSLGAITTDAEGLAEVANLSVEGQPGRLSVWVDAAFRELLLFTPAHRRSVAIEPYTCASDGMNLTAEGHDSGWRVLPAGQKVHNVVEYRYSASM